MAECKHQRILQTTKGKFCYDCGLAQSMSRPKAKSAPPSKVGIARIWERKS